MKCAWQELLNILPLWMRREVDSLGKENLQELRLRTGYPPELRLSDNRILLRREVAQSDIAFCMNTASQYSPWAAQSCVSGYITAAGGHRIGICGEVVVEHRQIRSMKKIRSLCIRVARDFPGIAAGIKNLSGSALIIGPPGYGKPTLLRDLIRQSSAFRQQTVAVVDERGELFPDGIFDPGPSTDVLSGCAKAYGLDMLLRTMGPDMIAVDEITAEEDCDALIRAGNCGVRLLATCHAAGPEDLLHRPVYQKLVGSGLFSTLVILQRDKSFTLERMVRI